jgi:hypothetical protein
VRKCDADIRLVQFDQHADLLRGELVHPLSNPVFTPDLNTYTQGRQNEHPSPLLPHRLRQTRPTMDRTIARNLDNRRFHDGIQSRRILRTYFQSHSLFPPPSIVSS